MITPTPVAINTSRASRQPLFANSQRQRITHTIEINLPAGTSNEDDTASLVRTDSSFFPRRLSIGSAAQVLA